MKNISWILGFLIIACTDSRETRLQRFLLKGNERAAKQNYTEAKRYFKEAVKIDTCFADAWNNLGTVYFKEKNYHEALDCYTRALICRPDFYPVYLNKSNTLYELEQPDAALRDLEIYEKAKPDTSILFFAKALIYTKKQLYDTAVFFFRQAFEKDTGNAEVLVNLGTVYYYKKEFDSARVILNRALNLAGDEPNAFNTLSLIEAEAGNYEEALNWIDNALQIRPADPYFLNNRGYLYLLTGDLTGALKDIDRSISEDPYNAWAYRNKGAYYLKTNDIVSAIRLLEKALGMNPQIDKIHLFLGEAYEKKGEKDISCTNYSKALQKHELTDAEYARLCR